MVAPVEPMAAAAATHALHHKPLQDVTKDGNCEVVRCAEQVVGNASSSTPHKLTAMAMLSTTTKPQLDEAVSTPSTPRGEWDSANANGVGAGEWQRSRVTAPSISPRMCGARRARKTRCGTDEPLLKDEVLENLRRKELQNRAAADYFPSQPHLNARMRAVLVDWLIEVHYRFKFHNETLFLAVNYIDRYLEKVVIARCHLQLVGVTALLLASKFEEVHPIEITDLVYISDKTYTVQQIIDCEQSMLNTLQFQLTCSTCHHFLGYMFQVLQTDLLVAQLAAYYSQHALLDVHICTTFAPSKLAAACLFLAQTAAESQLPPAAWVLRFEAASMYSSDDLVSCINTLRGSLATPSCKLIAARNKFGSKKFGCVANIALPDHWSAPHNA